MPMRLRFRPVLLTLCLCSAIACGTAFAGFDQAVAAYERKDYVTAFREFRPLAQQGKSSAQYSLGWMYAKGQGVAQDHKEAVKWYRLAADQGDAFAQYNLGGMYAKGQGAA